ncbi:Uncharacterised protein (plasmid) [Tsukamurella tyrosinosolvens]|uniref:F5/8 type C domain-containing protein n=1 Tax=Tsukamurella tyrosinosolvens TaxID=57704 RepID=A0A1H4VQ51_TSUTY|nr:hypothetical protein [Tsukamurella tyrosinosolvens]KXO90918.1 hypothetical protein AXK58_21020 [Tsukamurella tyrosinosolvens]SEC83065.1 hypothetical protein SAMN04489793_3298 [Tsukamurella tyrosinosolvens]VEH90376.1 Uncharacterised protein [Tsukamurella tyrosinosolvens]
MSLDPNPEPAVPVIAADPWGSSRRVPRLQAVTLAAAVASLVLSLVGLYTTYRTSEALNRLGAAPKTEEIGAWPTPVTPRPPGAAAPSSATDWVVDWAAPEVPLTPLALTTTCNRIGSDPVGALAQNPTRAWVCGSEDTRPVLNIVFEREVAVSAVTFVPGYDYVDDRGVDMWTTVGSPTLLTWRTGGSVYTQPVRPGRAPVTFRIDSTVASRALSVTVLAATGSSEDPAPNAQTMALSRLTIMGRVATPRNQIPSPTNGTGPR